MNRLELFAREPSRTSGSRRFRLHMRYLPPIESTRAIACSLRRSTARLGYLSASRDDYSVAPIDRRFGSRRSAFLVFEAPQLEYLAETCGSACAGTAAQSPDRPNSGSLEQ